MNSILQRVCAEDYP